MGLFRKQEGGENKGGRLKQAFEMAKPALNLSPQQETQIMEIFNQFREERQGLKSGGGDNAREEIRSARKEMKQKIMNVLNDDQKRILEENLKKLKEEAE